MSKALKILSANFSTNALAQIEYDEEIPCTGITLDQSTLSFETLEETKQLTPTVSPADSTDIVVWTSSNENVATVSDGMVTIHGIGTATITATCGSYSASASISQTTIKSNIAVKVLENYLSDKNSNLGIVSVVSYSGGLTFGQTYTNNDKLRIGGQSSIADADKIELIPVPYGATTAKFSTTGGTITFSKAFIADMNDIITPVYDRYPKWLSTLNSASSAGISVQVGQCFCVRTTATDLGEKTVDYVYFV